MMQGTAVVVSPLISLMKDQVDGLTADGVPAYIVFGDRALRDMARLRPSTPAGFLKVSGVGEAKKDRYGDRFLELIKDYCASHGLETG